MTELIWEGKYDKNGKKVAPLRVALPFQTVETINESAQQRQLALEAWSVGKTSEWRNRLIWGDKKYVLPALLEEFAGQVNLIYIDPPFDTGQNFSFKVNVNGEDFTKEPSIIEQKAYRDTWGRGLDSYPQWFYETIVLLHELLHETGSIYVHCDWRVNSRIRLIMDEVFGNNMFQNELIWYYPNSGLKAVSSKFHQVTDTIYVYNKGENATFHRVRRPRKDGQIKQAARKFNPVTKKADMVRDEDGKIVYLTIEDVLVNSMWEIPMLSQGSERVGYDTQKPEALLERIIEASSDPGDLILDCFVGSGTTAIVAERLNRRWIACDLSRFAIHTTRKRLLPIPGVKPFVVQNLGKYERQFWQAAEFGEQAEARMLKYRNFIMELYHAKSVTGYAWLHGVKAGRMVHVGAVDSPVSTADVAQIAAEFKRAVGTGKDAPKTNGVDVLGWDFAFELNEVAKQQAAQANINVRFLRIPREVLEKKAVEQGDIRFFELAALSVDVEHKGQKVTLKLTDFVIPPDDVPEDVRRAITHWEQWIDYWAVDWNNRDDTFHNEWQDYRTRKKRELQKSVSHTYDQPGKYVIVVKVIDILGNDTTKTLSVEVR